MLWVKSNNGLAAITISRRGWLIFDIPPDPKEGLLLSFLKVSQVLPGDSEGAFLPPVFPGVGFH